jgi:hypothetical protein
MALGSNQPRTEMSIRNLRGGKGRPTRKADNLTAISEPIVSQPYGPPQPVTGLALPPLSSSLNQKRRVRTLGRGEYEIKEEEASEEIGLTICSVSRWPCSSGDISIRWAWHVELTDK